MPKAHCAQEGAPASLLNVLRPQSRQPVAGLGYFPAGHAEHAVLPTASVESPGPHTLQLAAPVALEKEPIAQGAQEEAPPSL